jgi:uracil-DNA glycosylase
MSQQNDPFHGTKGSRTPVILIVGEAYGALEEQQGKPFVGGSGTLLEQMLHSAGLSSAPTLYTNVVNTRPKDNHFEEFLIDNATARETGAQLFRGVYAKPELVDGYHKLHTLIALTRPKIIIALGNWALWALTNKFNRKSESGTRYRRKRFWLSTGIDTHRGSMHYYAEGTPFQTPLLPTYHPAGILRNWPWRNIAVRDLRRVSAFLGGFPWEDTRKYQWIIKPNSAEVKDWVDRFLSFRQPDLNLVLDLETYAGQTHIYGFRDKHSCLCIPTMHITKQGTSPAYPQADYIQILRHIRRLLSDPRVGLVGQNLSYDVQYLNYWLLVNPRIAFDTMVAQHTLYSQLRKGLDFIASMYCNHYRFWKAERKESLTNEDTRLSCEYNCRDLEYTFEAWKVEKQLLTQRNLTEQFSLLLDMQADTIAMMFSGIRCDPGKKAEMSMALLELEQEISSWLEETVPDILKPPFDPKAAQWYNSDKQLAQVVYDNLGLRPVFDRKTGNRSLGKEALIKLTEQYPHYAPFFNGLVILRSIGTFYRNFLRPLADPDGRYRCSYNPTATVTYRLSSSKNVFGRGLNLQNIPRERNPITVFNALEEIA